MKKKLLLLLAMVACFSAFSQNHTFSARNTYLYFGYNTSMDIKMPDLVVGSNLSTKMKNEFGGNFKVGKTFYLHNKAIANMIKFGIDWSILNLNYNQYKLTYANTGNTAFKDPNNAAASTMMHYVEAGMEVGPSVTFNPISSLCLSVYFRYCPTYALNIMSLKDYESSYGSSESSSELRHGYSSNLAYGFSISWKAISVGYEMLNSSVKFQNLSDSNDEKVAYKGNGGRAYIGFRF